MMYNKIDRTDKVQFGNDYGLCVPCLPVVLTRRRRPLPLIFLISFSSFNIISKNIEKINIHALIY